MLSWEDNTFDAAAICVSVQYLQKPVEVFNEIARVLRPAAPLIVTFSNRCFPTKATAIWRALQGPQHQQLIAAFMQSAGFQDIAAASFVPREGDPLWTVTGQAPEKP
jgi:ubiquinone/menaquinone biosynthesis C-methylase UbiE